MILFIGVFFTSALLLGAVTFDFARLANLKAELQTSADAGAHAGIWSLIRIGFCDSGGILMVNEARAVALANLAMQGVVTVDTNQVGDYNPATGVFTPLGTCFGVDAIRVVVSRRSTGLFMSLVGVTAPRVRAGATGYRCPMTGSPSCIRVRPILVR